MTTLKQDPAGGYRCKQAGQYHHGNLRCTLIAVAGEILEQEGVAGLSLREVARRAGVSQAAPYRHFADKEAVLAALASEGFRILARFMAKAASGVESSRERIGALGRGYVSFATKHPCLLRLMFGAEIADKDAYPELREASRAAYGLIDDAVARRLAEPDAASFDAGTATIAAWALVHGLATLLIDRQISCGTTSAVDEEALAAAVSGILINGLRAGDS